MEASAYRSRPIRKRLPEYFIDQETNEAVPATLSSYNVDEELKCGICLDPMKMTVTVVACFHRFCTECLHQSLRTHSGSEKQNHECPLCRVKIPSRRSSKPDPTFDALIGILAGGGDAAVNKSMTKDGMMISPGGTSMSSSITPRRGTKDAADVAAAFRKVHEANVRMFRQRAEAIRNNNQNNHNGSNGGDRDGYSNNDIQHDDHRYKRSASGGYAGGRGSAMDQPQQYVQWSLEPLPVEANAETGQGLSALQRNSGNKSSSSSSSSSSSRNEYIHDEKGSSYFLGGSSSSSSSSSNSSNSFNSRGNRSKETFKLHKPYLRSSASLTIADVKTLVAQKLCLAIEASQTDSYQQDGSSINGYYGSSGHHSNSHAVNGGDCYPASSSSSSSQHHQTTHAHKPPKESMSLLSILMQGHGGEDLDMAAMAVAQAKAIDIFTRSRQQHNRLAIVLDDVTLRDICLHHWDAQSELNLYYRINPYVPNTSK